MNSPRYKTFGFAVVMLVMTLAAAAYSASPVTSDVIHGCVNARTRQLRVVSGPGQCIQNMEFALSWNKTGPQGPQGPEGPAGSSPYVFQQVFSDDHKTCTLPPCEQIVMAECPQDFIRVSLVDCTWDTGNVVAESVTPFPGKTRLGCKFTINSSGTVFFQATMLCVKGV